MKVEGEANQKVADGIYYQIITEVKGKFPAKTDRVTVNYTGITTPAADLNKDASAAQLAKGKLLGKVFDSSEKTGNLVTFRLNQVITCWTDA